MACPIPWMFPPSGPSPPPLPLSFLFPFFFLPHPLPHFLLSDFLFRLLLPWKLSLVTLLHPFPWAPIEIFKCWWWQWFYCYCVISQEFPWLTFIYCSFEIESYSAGQDGSNLCSSCLSSWVLGLKLSKSKYSVKCTRFWGLITIAGKNRHQSAP